MSLTKKALGLAVVATLAMSGFMQQAQARPQYVKAFTGLYPDNKAAAEAKCGICHPVMDKKERNDYGIALTKLLGEKNQKDEAKIKEALQKAEGEKSGTAGKTFGELIKEGKLPGKK